ncbi:hypothetical protein VUR80DRAFT_714 [Thermomyces stellatus]
MSFPNVYAHRKVAETAKRGCDVCFRPTSSVLLSEGTDTKDFFFVCPAHLTDRKFCTPIVDENAAEARKKKAMEEEMERVKREYEEKKRKKDAEKEKRGENSEEKDGEKEKDKSKNEREKEGDKANDGRDSEKGGSSPSTPSEEPRFFALHSVFFNQRVQKRREAEMAKRNRERLQQPNLFPSVPKNLPGT